MYEPKKCAVEAGCICATCVRNKTEKEYWRCCYQDKHMCLDCPDGKDQNDSPAEQFCSDYVKAEEVDERSGCK